MSAGIWQVKTAKVKRWADLRRSPGAATHAMLKRDVERGVEYFWAQRPWCEKPVPVHGQSAKRTRAMMGLDEAVRVALAIGEPRRGVLKGMAEANRLDYHQFLRAYHKARGRMKSML